MLVVTKVAGLLSAVVICAAVPLACSSSSGGGGGGNSDGGEGGNGEGGGEGGGMDAGGDAAPVIVNACKTFVDMTAPTATRTIPWAIPLVAPERCMTIKVDESVTWNGDFTMHPLLPFGGDTPNPVTDYDMMTGKVMFKTKGTFGYMCGNHPSMIGTIQVIE